MPKPSFQLLVLLFAMQAAVLCAQNTEKPTPKFTLTISIFHPGSSEPGLPEFREIEVTETNISNEPIAEGYCWDSIGIYSTSVLYNGAPLEERDRSARGKREADAKLGIGCPKIELDSPIMPGKTRTRWLPFDVDYPLCKPGTYEITVSRESDLEHPEKSVTVKSNALTIVVPEPARCEE